jgi:hypothetical protein
MSKALERWTTSAESRMEVARVYMKSRFSFEPWDRATRA